ncbi:hypothetical protein Tsubulata_044786 [Turnera subulata]|uniref:Ubiquitin thioesterase OTU n=1 Tax=Turnera subulata TaxID=218843 RepID=A0A9Q0G223_9ROSI|nr:hypothetical protein Tsubulata_044786 [Turnera subulata]
MLGVLCARPKPWILSSLIAHSHHGFSPAPYTRLVSGGPVVHFSSYDPSSPAAGCGAAASLSLAHSQRNNQAIDAVRRGSPPIWHVIQPSEWRRKRRGRVVVAEPQGEGSWNVAWDARPARWLYRPDSAWLMFGFGASLAAPIDFWTTSDVGNLENNNVSNEDGKKIDDGDCVDGKTVAASDVKSDSASADYKVTGVLADGRCLFRAIAHVACLRNGEEAPDENRQRELADELRARVVEELLKRREESEWFIEGDFDTYVKRIQEPYVWGGEPELLMASHVLKTKISVFMIDRATGNLVNIANYGEEYQKDETNPINVLFHGYGHYDILETSNRKYETV